MIYTDIRLYRRRQLANRLVQLKAMNGSAQLDPRWLLPDAQGRMNFCVWLESLYKALPSNVKWSTYCLKRINESLPWLQENCHLMPLKEEFAKNPRTPLSDEQVKNIRTYIENNPNATLTCVSKLHKVSVSTVSKIRRHNKAGQWKKGLQ